METPITKAQNKKLHVLLSHQPGLMEAKREFLLRFTNGRTNSAKRLTRKEAAEIIDVLEREDPCRKMIRKIFAIAHSMKWISPKIGMESERRMNEAVIDMFLKRRGIKKKLLREYSCAELPSLVSQFEQIERHSRESLERKEYNDEIASILMELSIESSFKSNS